MRPPRVESESLGATVVSSTCTALPVLLSALLCSATVRTPSTLPTALGEHLSYELRPSRMRQHQSVPLREDTGPGAAPQFERPVTSHSRATATHADGRGSAAGSMCAESASQFAVCPRHKPRSHRVSESARGAMRCGKLGRHGPYAMLVL